MWDPGISVLTASAFPCWAIYLPCPLHCLKHQQAFPVCSWLVSPVFLPAPLQLNILFLFLPDSLYSFTWWLPWDSVWAALCWQLRRCLYGSHGPACTERLSITHIAFQYWMKHGMGLIASVCLASASVMSCVARVHYLCESGRKERKRKKTGICWIFFF